MGTSVPTTTTTTNMSVKGHVRHQTSGDRRWHTDVKLSERILHPEHVASLERAAQKLFRLLEQAVGGAARIAMDAVERWATVPPRTVTIVPQVGQRTANLVHRLLLEGDARRVVHAFRRSERRVLVRLPADGTAHRGHAARTVVLAERGVARPGRVAFRRVERIAPVRPERVRLGGLRGDAALVDRPLGNAGRGHAKARRDAAIGSLVWVCFAGMSRGGSRGKQNRRKISHY